jgi:hypothetical protein
MEVLPARPNGVRPFGQVPLSYNVCLKRLPAADFKYFSRSRAEALSMQASVYIFTHGRYAFVEVTRPLL